MAKKDEKAGEVEDVIDAGKAQGGNTATGQEAKVRSGEEGERLEGQESRGGPEPDEKIQPDFLKPAKNIGLQNEPADFVVNGSVPPRHVASNSGLVPVGAFAASPEDAETRLAEHEQNVQDSMRARSSSRRPIDDVLIDKMSGAELRAVATDRGYDLSSTLGTRGTRAVFRRLQSEDKSLEKE
jgi:hypothetical protein